LSQEISVATGKPLEAVTNAIGKAFEGSNTALSKLGIGIDKATLATLTFDETQQLLNKTFDGFIENQSETAAFKFQQISIAVNESKEAIGAALLPVVKELADFLIVSVVPAIESFVAGLTGKDSLAEGLSESQTKAIEWGKKVRGIIDTVIDLKDELIAVAVVIGTVFVVSKISAAVLATIALINTLIKAYNLLKASAVVAGVASAFALNPLLGVGAVALAAGVYLVQMLWQVGQTPDQPKHHQPDQFHLPQVLGHQKWLCLLCL
jgi:large-conductance mechanosensitive channel